MANSPANSARIGLAVGRPHASAGGPSFEVKFPQEDETADIQQSEEIIEIIVKQRIRIHDYETMFSYPGLYE